MLALRRSGSDHRARRLVPLSLAVFLSSAFAVADTHVPPVVPPIVLESNVGERPANIGTILEPLIAELEGYGFGARPETIVKVLGGRVPRPGILDEGITAARIAQLIDSGLDAFSNGRFQEAVDALHGAIRLIHRNPGVWALDSSSAGQTYKALVKLSLALARLDNAQESSSAMMDLVRISSVPVSQTEHGPKAVRIYKAARSAAQSLGRSSLIVSVSDKRAVIFVDNQFRGIGKIEIGDMIPGPRNMFIQLGNEGRQYNLDLPPNGEYVLDIDWSIHSILTVADRGAGLLFASETEQAKEEGAYARKLGRAWGCDRVITVGLVRRVGELEVSGTVYFSEGGASWNATVPVSEGAEGMHALARFLFDGTRSKNLSVRGQGPGMYASSAIEDRPGTRSLRSELVLGAGALTLGGSIAAYRLAGDHTMPSTYNDRKAHAVYAMVAGSAVLGAGGYLWLRDTTGASRVTSAALALGSAAIVAGGILYVTDEDPLPTARYYRQSAPLSVAVGATGLALTGAGAWLWYHQTRQVQAAVATAGSATEPVLVMPTLTVAPSQVALGFAGRF